MKHIVPFFMVIFIFFGCAPKEQIVEIKPPSKEQVETEKKTEVLIEEVEPVQIEEEEIPFLENAQQLKIAFIYPSKFVARYAKTSIATIMGYLSYKKLNYSLKVIDTHTESPQSIQNAFEQTKNLGITNVIALFTPRATFDLHQLDTSSMRVYLPLFEKKDVSSPNYNFVYGSISYEEQIKKLLEYSNDKNSMFYQESFLGYKLKSKFETLGVPFFVEKKVSKKRNYFRGLVKDYRLNNSSLFLNTDIVKTSLILSQLTAHSVRPKVVLSTQQNYEPSLISLTQARDRTNFIIANSIGEVNDELKDEIATLGGDIVYKWVDYSTLVGVNYLYDSNSSNLLNEEIENNQVIYTPRLFKATNYGFSEIK